MIDKADPIIYEIRLKESLNCDPREWFEGMNLTNEVDGSTRLTGPVIDQAALFGILYKVSALGLTLISVNRVDASSESDCVELK
jgi:hypothetical protein